jgi:hypothetical protein
LIARADIMSCNKYTYRAVAIAMAAGLLAASVTAEDYPSLIREQRAVMIDGIREAWRLQWDAPPQSACGPEDLEVALACPCRGFAYGESGKLALLRMRSGAPPERLELAPFFKDLGVAGAEGAAVVQRWRPIPAAAHDEEDDWHHAADFDFLKRIRARGPSTVMKFGDYNHDGRASELLLQVGTHPCGTQQLVLVGVSRYNPHLHVFAAAEAPAQPLVLSGAAWAAVLKNPKPAPVVETSCDVPENDTETLVIVAVRQGAFHVRRESRPCPKDGGADGNP